MSKENYAYGHGTETISLNADPETQRSREIKEKRRIENWQRKYRYELTVHDIQNKNQELNYKKPSTGDKEPEWMTKIKEKCGQNGNSNNETGNIVLQHEEKRESSGANQHENEQETGRNGRTTTETTKTMEDSEPKQTE